MTDYRVPAFEDFEWQQPVEDKDLTTSPAASKGDRYIVAGIGGLWSVGAVNDIAYYDGSNWQFDTPTEGFVVWVKDENAFYKFNGSTWSKGIGIVLDDIDDFTIKLSGSAIKVADRLELNTMLNAFRIAVNGSLSQLSMVDGISDEYEDETGVDTANSTNEDYDAVNDLYEPTRETADINTDTKLMLHCNGTDTSTSFPDASDSNHTLTANGNAQVDTTNKKWGTGSLQLDGSGDYLTAPDSTDWDVVGSNSDDWTIDLWVKHNLSHTYRAIGHYASTSNYWALVYSGGSGFYFESWNPGEIVYTNTAGIISDTNWHHVAVCKIGADCGVYLDGTQYCYDTMASTATFTGLLQIGRFSNGSQYLNGYMDEIRIQNSNPFSAAPDSGKTDTIVTPTAEYGAVATVYNMTLISNSETAEAQPDTARLIIYEEDVDSITVNTDIKGYITRDGGTTYTQVTLSDEGDYENGKRILTGTADISGQPAGTSIEYKLTTLNNKDQKIHGVAVLWD